MKNTLINSVLLLSLSLSSGANPEVCHPGSQHGPAQPRSHQTINGPGLIFQDRGQSSPAPPATGVVRGTMYGPSTYLSPGQRLATLERQLARAESELANSQSGVAQADEALKEASQDRREAEQDLADARAAVEQAEQALDQANRPPSEGDSVSSNGETVTSRDLRLKEQADQEAWEEYQKGDITAEELSERWSSHYGSEAREQRREQDEQEREQSREEAQEALDQAREQLEQAEQAAEEAREAERQAQEQKSEAEAHQEQCRQEVAQQQDAVSSLEAQNSSTRTTTQEEEPPATRPRPTRPTRDLTNVARFIQHVGQHDTKLANELGSQILNGLQVPAETLAGAMAAWAKGQPASGGALSGFTFGAMQAGYGFFVSYAGSVAQAAGTRMILRNHGEGAVVSMGRGERSALSIQGQVAFLTTVKGRQVTVTSYRPSQGLQSHTYTSQFAR